MQAKEESMFGRMKAQAIVNVGCCSTEHAVEALRKATDYAQPVRWIEFPASVLLLLDVTGDPDSGALYVFDRTRGNWFWLDFEDEQYSGYSVSDFDLLVHEYDFLSLVERPGLLRATPGWLLEPGKPAEMAQSSK
jgi:hypothetical protein